MKQNYFKQLLSFVLALCGATISAQTISNVSPPIGMEGTTINVSISGQNSNFLQGTTTVWFNQGSSTIYASNVTVSSATDLTAQLGIPYGTPLGLYQTNVQDPVDNTISLPASFTVIANPNSPAIVSVSPSATMEGTSLTVSISGQNTNFQQGTTTVWFNQGSSTIYSSNVNVNSLTNLDAYFNIPYGTPLGLYNTNVNDPVDNTVTSINSFTITANPNAPQLISVNPDTGTLGSTLPVTISGQNTNFLQGTGTLIFMQGSSTLYTSGIVYNTNTTLDAILTIPSDANPGYYDVYFTNPLDGTMLLVDGFYVNPPPCGNIDVLITQQPCPGTPAGIAITGGFAPYTMLIDGQSISGSGNYVDYYPSAIGDFVISSVVDNFGCPATTIDSIIHNDVFTASFSGTSACVGSALSFNTNITSGYPIISTYYYYGDGFASTSFTHNYNYEGTYTPTMQVSNSNGCSIFVNIDNPIQILPLPQDSIVSLTNANCGLTNGAFEINGTGNGPFTFDVNGVGGYTSNTALNTSLSAGVYTIQITDANGCSSSTALSIANVSSLTNITGHIQTSTGTDANNTTVKLFSLADTIGAMGVSYTTLTDANGNYSFSNLIEANYILVAEPDSTLFSDALPTYYNNAFAWYEADTIQVNCTSQAVLDLTLLGGVAQIGNAQIGGFVYDYMFNFIPDAGIVLFDDNAGQAVARTSTDANGAYNFAGINAGHYSLLIDIPGLILNSNYSYTVSDNDALFWGYFADFGTQLIDTVMFIVGQKESVRTSTKVFPNPFTNQTTISYALPTASNVSIEVYNYVGEKVATLENENKQAGPHLAVFNINDRARGIYFVRISTKNTSEIVKIISVD